MELLVPLLILGAMWLVLVRPQQRRVREHREFVATVSVGDEIVTSAGIYGTVTALDDERARVRIAPDVEVTIARLAISRPQGEPAAPPTPQDHE
ncbi:MAG TPA: preprotein translocase subunit YajC [Nocardioides sp.]|nr:preprotein translocase subunit YajC [Nocardioides sp.]